MFTCLFVWHLYNPYTSWFWMFYFLCSWVQVFVYLVESTALQIPSTTEVQVLKLYLHDLLSDGNSSLNCLISRRIKLFWFLHLNQWPKSLSSNPQWSSVSQDAFARKGLDSFPKSVSSFLAIFSIPCLPYHKLLSARIKHSLMLNLMKETLRMKLNRKIYRSKIRETCI